MGDYYEKKICFSIPCYNEEENIELLVEAIEKIMKNELSDYNYEIHFIDNASTDRTQEILRSICDKNKCVKAIFNGRNFPATSKFHGIIQTYGDCTISMVSDFQDPIDMIVPFVREWEAGAKTVIGVKKSGDENKLMFWIRKRYYSFMNKYSRTEQIEGFNGFGLYDRTFIDFLRQIEDPLPSFRGLISEYSYSRKVIEYNQPKRERGESKNNFSRLYNNAIINLVSYTKIAVRFMMLLGIIMFVISSLTGIAIWISRTFGIWSVIGSWQLLVVIILWVSSLQLIFMGILGEYIMEMNYRILKRPRVIEKERLNYE